MNEREEESLNKGVFKTTDLEEKEIAFMHSCLNWGAEVCNHEVSKWKSLENMRENEGVVLSPAKEEVDEICQICEARKTR